MDYFSHHPWPFSYARVSLLDTAAAASPSIDFSRLPSPEYNYSTTSSCSSPSLHFPFFASPNSSASPAQQRFELQPRRRFSKRVELASSNTSFPCYPHSDSDCQSPLVALTGPSPLTKLASAFVKTDLSLRAFAPEAVADLLVRSQQLELSRISSPDPSSAFRRSSGSHLRPVLLLDVRTFVRQSESQIRSAVNISIPNALLKRSSFTIDKIRDTLSSKRARSMLRDWSSYANIIIYDANSVTLNDTVVISYLARKFRQENCTAELGWLYGGYDDFSLKYPELCEPSFPEANSSKHVLLSRPSNLSRDNQLSPPTTADEIDNDQQPQLAKRKPSHRLSTNRPDVSTGPLTCPTSSTLGSEGGGDTTNHIEESLRKEKEGGIAQLQTTNIKDKPSDKCCCHLPFVSPVEEKVAIRLPSWITEHKEGSDMRSENGGRCMRKPKSVAEDLELPVSNHSNHFEVEMNAHNVPQFLKELAIGRDSEQKLAKIFQTIEKAEQRRLRSLMLHHARHPTTDHPFNISAGVERGEKNRYVNIWPYDYTRVRLGQTLGVRKSGDDSDYVNASLIKAPHCEQTYIATQGPLPTTFNDFWNVVWSKDIKVIVMLTREEEGGQLRCHRYWPDEKDLPVNYGPTVTVELLNKETLPDGDGSIIRRYFRMRYIPTGTTRIIVQFQYIGWPDFGVPDTPLAVLQLRAAVLAGPAIHEKSTVGSQSRQDRESPILVHCSAGCGRTGAFCTIDSTLRLLGRLDGPFGCSNADAIASDVVLAKQEAEIEARDHDKAEREDATLPAFSSGNFSVATALNPEPTPDTFRLKMPKFLKGNRRGAAVGQLKDAQTANNGSAVKSIRETDMRGSPIRNQTATTACSPSEGKLTRQSPNNISHPPLPSAVYTPLPYPNLLPSAESRCTRDVVRGCVEVFREQRLSMVQTLAQFVFCYEAVLWQLMGVPNPAVDNKKVDQTDNHVACCGGPVEQKRQPPSPACNQKANLMEAQHTESITPKDDIRVNPLQLEKIRKRKRNELLEGCCPRDDNICSSSSCPFPSKSSSNGPCGKRTLVNEASSDTHPLPYLPCHSLSTYLAYQSPLPENRFPITPGEQGDLKTQADASFDFKSLKGMELPGPPNERGLRESEDLAKNGTESKVAISTDPLFREATLWETSRMNHVPKSSKISSSNEPGAKIDGGSASCTDETKADTSTEIDVATLSVTSVSLTFAGSDRSSTNSSPANAVTSRGLALILESGPASSLERSTLRFGPSLNLLGFNIDDHLQGDVLNAAIRSATEAKEREPTDQNTKENATPIIRSCGRFIKRKEVDEYFPIQPVLFPPSHVDVYDSGDGAHFWPAAFPIQNSKARLPSTAFFDLPSTLRDVYGRRRSDPCVAVNTISLLRTSPEEFHRYHTRSSGPRGAMFGLVGLSPTSSSH